VIVGVGATIFITLFLAFSVAMVADGETALAPFIFIAGPMWLLITPATVLGLIRLARDRTVLEFGPSGLRLPGLGWIPWADIERLAIEDTRPLVEPNANVIGSMRQLAIHLREDAQAPRGNALDQALRWVGRGFLAMSAAAGRGRYHWLTVPERFLDVPLEDVLDVASVYHARVVGLAAYDPAPVSMASTETATIEDLPPRLPMTRPDPALSAEAAAIRTAEGGAALDRERRLWSRALPAALFIVAIVGFSLVGIWGRSSNPSTTDPGPPTAGPPTAGTSVHTGAEGLELHVRASDQTGDGDPGLAIDGDTRTAWNAGVHPPAWIEIDLGVEGPVTSVRLLVEQSPTGPTVHHVLLASGDGRYELVHTFDGVTESGQWLTFTPDGPIPAVRAVLIETVASPSWVAWREVVVRRP
jgi:hypothetical protein